MPTVGDLITRVRGVANDSCQTLGQPIAPTLAIGAAGIFSGHIFGILTYLNLWGETVGSTEVDLAGFANNAANLSGMVPPLAAVTARLYYATASGQEQQFIAFTPGVTATVGLATDTPQSGQPPYKSSAFLPDTDGDLVDASTIYRWINAGLVQLGRLAGGILDQTGVAMPAGNAEIPIPGWWLSIKYTWHNGWMTLPEQQSYTWLQSPVQGIPGIVTLWRNGAQQVMGTWPQPSIAPALTILTADMGANDNVAQVESTSDFHGTDGVMGLGDFILNSNAGGFATGSMANLAITVKGAGPAGADLVTTIAAVVSPNQLQLADAAQTAVGAAIFDITGSGAPGFTAPGMCQIDDEIMSYSSVSTANNQLNGLVRGYSGTIATSHKTNATVKQLIFRLLGRRMPVQVALGQSANVLDLPQTWDTILDYFLLANYKATEQNTDESLKLMQLFEAKARELKEDALPSESKQIGGLYPLGGAAQTLADIQDTVIVN